MTECTLCAINIDTKVFNNFKKSDVIASSQIDTAGKKVKINPKA